MMELRTTWFNTGVELVMVHFRIFSRMENGNILVQFAWTILTPAICESMKLGKPENPSSGVRICIVWRKDVAESMKVNGMRWKRFSGGGRTRWRLNYRCAGRPLIGHSDSGGDPPRFGCLSWMQKRRNAQYDILGSWGWSRTLFHGS